MVMLEYLCELIKCIVGLSDRRAHASSVVRVFGCVVEAKLLMIFNQISSHSNANKSDNPITFYAYF